MSKPDDSDQLPRKSSNPARTYERTPSNFERMSASSSSLGRAPTMRHKSVAVLPTSAADKFIGHAATGICHRATNRQPPLVHHTPHEPMVPPVVVHHRCRGCHHRVAHSLPHRLYRPSRSLVRVCSFCCLSDNHYTLHRPYASAGSIIQYVLTALITIDICVTFFVARFVEGELVTDLRQLAKNYLKLYFWVDLLSVIPFETIGAVIAGYTYGPSDVTSQYINLLKLTYMVRMVDATAPAPAPTDALLPHPVVFCLPHVQLVGQPCCDDGHQKPVSRVYRAALFCLRVLFHRPAVQLWRMDMVRHAVLKEISVHANNSMGLVMHLLHLLHTPLTQGGTGIDLVFQREHHV